VKKALILILFIFIISCVKKQSYPTVLIKDPALIEKQQDKVESILWTGKLSIKAPQHSLNADILVIGKRAPFNIRIEVTNWLSGPIFYILIKKKKVFVLSIKEKKLYLMDLNSRYFIQFFPSQLNQKQIWAILRGLPTLKENNMKIRFSTEDTLIFVSQKTEIRFKDYRIYQGLIFAKNINIRYYPTNTEWRLSIGHIQFNKNIPADIFKLNIPSDFQ